MCSGRIYSICCRTAYASVSQSLRKPLQCSIIMQLRKGYDAANSPGMHLACQLKAIANECDRSFLHLEFVNTVAKERSGFSAIEI